MLQGDDRLLERMYCFDDPVGLGDAGAAAVTGSRRVVVSSYKPLLLLPLVHAALQLVSRTTDA